MHHACYYSIQTLGRLAYAHIMHAYTYELTLIIEYSEVDYCPILLLLVTFLLHSGLPVFAVRLGVKRELEILQ